MEIRFSLDGLERVLRKTDSFSTGPAVDKVAKAHGLRAHLTKEHATSLRFTLPGAGNAEHDNVIRALLTLDPDATVRTARAVYEGLEDFEKQRGKA